MDEPVSAADEVLDVVDRQDRVTGQAPRGEVYARGLIHRCVFVLARDAEDRIFVHRRTASKLVFPSHYDMFVGGVLGTGESYGRAALREAEEELGVRGLAQPEPLLKFLYEGPGGAWWSYVHEVRCDLPVSPQVSEVDWHTFLTREELDRRVADGQWPWVPDGLEAYRRLRAHRGSRQ
ncbi:NUDIX hydrolase [Streptomyces sp. WM6373]|nr:NUDIX hydrolase [Streptomyces sp. WM6373]KOU59417.1 NUDIX hydrolase [Streptomyces sp. IGB124]KOU72816.1 NUDIX hydrolase [Streptomyces sp. XY66]KOU85406.1 NUDIX hydrolase [Streptomyces sp. XY58]KOV05330.1 NUDIX hydrolase [Streptomyces sp. XY37]KOV17380.1 NUDIX hydrolase [Streptomyces sp. XY413]KOV28808.1 NUDIX hydrolase [Streptomyces sp. H021]KOV45688.1 NUDIX hydrolase [Streptomyces sp. MMG1064]